MVYAFSDDPAGSILDADPAKGNDIEILSHGAAIHLLQAFGG